MSSPDPSPDDDTPWDDAATLTNGTTEDTPPHTPFPGLAPADCIRIARYLDGTT
jgi:hypothetical protein